MLLSRQLVVGDKVIPRNCIVGDKRVDGLGRTEPREGKRRDFEQPGTFAWSWSLKNEQKLSLNKHSASTFTISSGLSLFLASS